MRRISLFALCLFGFLALPSAAQEAPPGITKSDRDELVQILQEIARGGRRTEALEVAAVLPVLGASADETNAAEADAYRLAAGCKQTTFGAMPAPGNKLKSVVKRLAKAVGALPETRRTAVAAALVRLDGTNAEVRTWAGHTLGPGGWLVPADVTGLERRAAWFAAMEAAAGRDIKIYVGKSRLPLAVNLSGGGAYEYEHHGIHLHTTYAPEIAKAMLREGVRGAWVLTTLMGGGSDGPKKRDFSTVILPTEGEYTTAVNLSSSANALTGGSAANAQARQFYVDRRGFVVRYALMPKFVSSVIASRYLDPYFPPNEDPPGWLIVGIDQLISLGYLRTPSGFYEQHGSVAAGSEETLRLPRGLQEARERINAGLAGSWSICIENIRAGTDMPLQECLHNDRALVIGEKLAKATLFVQFLYERNWLTATSQALITAKGNTPEAWRAGTGHTVEQLDRLWRSWVTGNQADLVSILAPPKEPKPDRKATEFIKALDEIRKSAVFDMRNSDQQKTPALDPRLTAGAQAHAEVLKGLGTPDRAAFRTPPVSAAGTTPLVSGTGWFGRTLANPKKAKTDLPKLLADPVLRCALLDPGMRAVGWSGAGPFAVVQADSAVGQTWNWRVVWPADRSKDVPLAIPAGDLPELEGDLASGERGYPVSIQLHSGSGKDAIKLLELQERDGAKVACTLISWTDPAWSARLRPYTYVLVPNAPLEKKTLYDVVARAVDGATTEWTFTTGR